MNDILKAIRTANKQQADIIIGEVVKFDKGKWQATIKFNETLELDEVTVKAVINSEKSGLFIEPKIGSIIACGLIDGKIENLFIICFSEVVKYQLTTDETVIESKKITFKNDQVNFSDLLTDLKTLLLGLKVNTPSGPSVGLLPDSVAAIEQLDAKFKLIFE
jgi:hypothetical protein